MAPMSSQLTRIRPEESRATTTQHRDASTSTRTERVSLVSQAGPDHLPTASAADTPPSAAAMATEPTKARRAAAVDTAVREGGRISGSEGARG